MKKNKKVGQNANDLFKMLTSFHGCVDDWMYASSHSMSKSMSSHSWLILKVDKSGRGNTSFRNPLSMCILVFQVPQARTGAPLCKSNTPWGRPRTHWRDYASHLSWQCLRMPQEELENMPGIPCLPSVLSKQKKMDG